MLRHPWLAAPSAPAAWPAPAGACADARAQQSEADILVTLADAQARRRRGRLLQPRPTVDLSEGFEGLDGPEALPHPAPALSTLEGLPRIPNLGKMNRDSKAQAAEDEAAGSAAGRENRLLLQPGHADARGAAMGGRAAAGLQLYPLPKKRPSEAAGLLTTVDLPPADGGAASSGSDVAVWALPDPQRCPSSRAGPPARNGAAGCSGKLSAWVAPDPQQRPSGQGVLAGGGGDATSSAACETAAWAAQRLHDAERRAALERGRLLAAARVARWRTQL